MPQTNGIIVGVLYSFLYFFYTLISLALLAYAYILVKEQLSSLIFFNRFVTMLWGVVGVVGCAITLISIRHQATEAKDKWDIEMSLNEK